MNIKDSLLCNLWKQIGTYPHHGIAIPLSAVRTKSSSGIGEFLDLLPLIDWCQTLEMDVIQLLPLNDSGRDPSPYNASSSCALNPIYLSLSNLPFLEEYPELTKQLIMLTSFNATPRVEYAAVLEKKMAWLAKYFEKTSSALTKKPEFYTFLSENPWVEPYALFKVLKENFQGQSWEEWPQEFKSPNAAEYSFLIEQHWVEICFYILLQYLCFEQLKQVKTYAGQKKIHLMGDIPILISRDSADVWHERSLFDLTKEAGAPPDMYIATGQNWGFPLYRWDTMKATEYSWWKRRLSYAANFFNLYRIDHIVGFFRIWGIPQGESSSHGEFIPSEEKTWGPQGKKLLSMMIKAAPTMLPVGEDLGTIPDITRETMQELGICGTKVMRWERRWKEKGEFIPISEYNPLSVTVVSTHDSETLSQWWKQMPQEAQSYAQFKQWHYTPVLTQEQRKEILRSSHKTPSFFHINPLQEYLAYFPELISSNPDEERINIPGKKLPANWTYRFRPSVEELKNHPYLTSFMKALHE